MTIVLKVLSSLGSKIWFWLLSPVSRSSTDFLRPISFSPPHNRKKIKSYNTSKISVLKKKVLAQRLIIQLVWWQNPFLKYTLKLFIWGAYFLILFTIQRLWFVFPIGMGMSEVAQSCLTLRDSWTVAHQAPPSMEYSRKEYWKGLPFPRRSSWPRNWTRVSRIVGRCFTIWATTYPMPPIGIGSFIYLVR